MTLRLLPPLDHRPALDSVTLDLAYSMDALSEAYHRESAATGGFYACADGSPQQERERVAMANTRAASEAAAVVNDAAFRAYTRVHG